MRRPPAGTRPARRSRSGGSTSSRTPGRTSTRRRIDFPAGRTWPASSWSASSTSTASSSTAVARPSAPSGRTPSRASMSAGEPSSSPPAGTSTGERQTYLSDNPFLTGAAADWLVGAGAALIGIDSLNVDSLTDPQPAGPHRDPRRRHPAGRAPDRPRRTPGHGLALLRRPAAHPRDGDVPGARLRHRRLRLLRRAAVRDASFGRIDIPGPIRLIDRSILADLHAESITSRIAPGIGPGSAIHRP